MLYLAVGVAGVTTLLASTLLLKEKSRGSTNRPAEASSEPPESKGKNESSYRLKEMFKNIGILVTSAVEAAARYVYGALEFFLTGYLKNVAQLDASLIGTIMGMQLVLIPIVSPFMGKISDKAGRRIPIILGLTISGIPLFMIPYTTSFLPLLAISLAYGLGFSMVISSTPALVGDLANKEFYGAAMGFLATIMDIGQMLGPVVTGVILATFGYSGSFFSLGAMLIVFCVFFAVSQRLTALYRKKRGS